ncbi:MAG: hypothetical protein DAHOPDDO_00796 [Ignavibacteriaceae bacterium]|nr:hypothetical protein [Ignavibacteriaceae bacterium]
MSEIKTFNGLEGFNYFCERIHLSSNEITARKKVLDESFMPFKVTEHFINMILSQNGKIREQLINIVLPFKGEKNFIGRFDPYGNRLTRKDGYSFLQHKYKKTLLLHIDDFCIANCQFCYKVNEIRIETPTNASIEEKIEITLNYLKSHPEIDNVLLTGGDPAAFRRTNDLIFIIDSLLTSFNVRIVRFATKGLAYEPSRFLDGELLQYFDRVNQTTQKQISIIIQLNHPAEFSDITIKAIKELQKVGVQLRGQPAIVKNVNDSSDTLRDLQRVYSDNKIISYYLTVFMPVRGVEQYAISLDTAFINVEESKRQLNGLEKKGVLLASHDFGKFEICGFVPNPENPQKIILKWHQASMSNLLPKKLTDYQPSRPGDVLLLEFDKESMYCIDHIFQKNNLPYYNSDGILIEET